MRRAADIGSTGPTLAPVFSFTTMCQMRHSLWVPWPTQARASKVRLAGGSVVGGGPGMTAVADTPVRR